MCLDERAHCVQTVILQIKVTRYHFLHSSYVFKPEEGKLLALKGMFPFVLVHCVKDKPAHCFTPVSLFFLMVVQELNGITS